MIPDPFSVHGLTRAELLEDWPECFPPPKSVTLWRWLDQAFDRGLVRRDGAGTRTDPHRYFLPEALARDPAMSPLGSPDK
jgi:hypothetical protein